ncbi:uncharacterized protein EI90DRAFT_3157396 [Cantharellus anzutake]|uniref:uncharacterized protein n=1 Tax=Cantharellus anzutake TaxID=1750568 RepID=UPI0019088EB0|nr:uncharacterized protein EI90DRAFT_3157396 [Cantharellus anzutake]KAF8324488.1 hypothetical protein EI90DRAFT_3157396 [Cantharellus anzutake]
MSTALAFWAQKLEPGKKIRLEQPAELAIKITGVTFDETLVNNERTSVKAHVKDEESDKPVSFVLANLIPGKIESQLLDLIVVEGEEIEFEVIGKNTVYLSGNLIYQVPPGSDDEFDEDDDDEDSYLLQDVGSDVEINPDELMDVEDEGDSGRFED